MEQMQSDSTLRKKEDGESLEPEDSNEENNDEDNEEAKVHSEDLPTPGMSKLERKADEQLTLADATPQWERPGAEESSMPDTGLTPWTQVKSQMEFLKQNKVAVALKALPQDNTQEGEDIEGDEDGAYPEGTDASDLRRPVQEPSTFMNSCLRSSLLGLTTVPSKEQILDPVRAVPTSTEREGYPVNAVSTTKGTFFEDTPAGSVAVQKEGTQDNDDDEELRGLIWGEVHSQDLSRFAALPLQLSQQLETDGITGKAVDELSRFTQKLQNMVDDKDDSSTSPQRHPDKIKLIQEEFRQILISLNADGGPLKQHIEDMKHRSLSQRVDSQCSESTQEDFAGTPLAPREQDQNPILESFDKDGDEDEKSKPAVEMSSDQCSDHIANNWYAGFSAIKALEHGGGPLHAGLIGRRGDCYDGLTEAPKLSHRTSKVEKADTAHPHPTPKNPHRRSIPKTQRNHVENPNTITHRPRTTYSVESSNPDTLKPLSSSNSSHLREPLSPTCPSQITSSQPLLTPTPIQTTLHMSPPPNPPSKTSPDSPLPPASLIPTGNSPEEAPKSDVPSSSSPDFLQIPYRNTMNIRKPINNATDEETFNILSNSNLPYRENTTDDESQIPDCRTTSNEENNNKNNILQLDPSSFFTQPGANTHSLAQDAERVQNSTAALSPVHTPEPAIRKDHSESITSTKLIYRHHPETTSEAAPQEDTTLSQNFCTEDYPNNDNNPNPKLHYLIHHNQELDDLAERWLFEEVLFQSPLSIEERLQQKLAGLPCNASEEEPKPEEQSEEEGKEVQKLVEEHIGHALNQVHTKLSEMITLDSREEKREINEKEEFSKDQLRKACKKLENKMSAKRLAEDKKEGRDADKDLDLAANDSDDDDEGDSDQSPQVPYPVSPTDLREPELSLPKNFTQQPSSHAHFPHLQRLEIVQELPSTLPHLEELSAIGLSSPSTSTFSILPSDIHDVIIDILAVFQQAQHYSTHHHHHCHHNGAQLPIPSPSAQDFSRVLAKLTQIESIIDLLLLQEEASSEETPPKHSIETRNQIQIQIHPSKIEEALNAENMINELKALTPKLAIVNKELKKIYNEDKDVVTEKELQKENGIHNYNTQKKTYIEDSEGREGANDDEDVKKDEVDEVANANKNGKNYQAKCESESESEDNDNDNNNTSV
ncbi:MAG: hypothetical protein Q9216_005590 [Gyalolechia sp. 2 TL-2023]